MKRAAIALVLLVLTTMVGAIVYAAQDEPPVLPATQLDLNAARVQQLERELAATHADLLKRDIDVSTCRATLDSVTLSDRAVRLVEEFKKAFGGDWIWSKDENRPVRPATGPKE